MTRVADLCLPADTPLYALDQGEGAPLLFFHGGLADHRAALLHLGGVEQHLRLVTPDLRGAGRSHWPHALDWRLLADDGARWLDHLGLERALVGGISMGSGVALAMALRHPARVAGLLLVHPVYPGARRGLAEAPRQAMAVIGAMGARVRTEGLGPLLALFEGLPDPIRARAREVARSFDPASVAATAALLASEVQPFEHPAELAALGCPVVVVPGEDPSHPAEVATLVADAIPGARLLPGSPAAAALALSAATG